MTSEGTGSTCNFYECTLLFLIVRCSNYLHVYSGTLGKDLSTLELQNAGTDLTVFSSALSSVILAYSTLTKCIRNFVVLIGI
jgi:hypothetical protein